MILTYFINFHGFMDFYRFAYVFIDFRGPQGLIDRSWKAENGTKRMAEAPHPPLPKTSLSAAGWSYRCYVFRNVFFMEAPQFFACFLLWVPGYATRS